MKVEFDWMVLYISLNLFDIEKLTDFEWYNDLGMTLSFKDNPCIGRRFSFPKEFYYNSEINRSRPIGIRWNFEGRVIDIPNVRKKGSCPVPSMDKVIVSYEKSYKLFMHL